MVQSFISNFLIFGALCVLCSACNGQVQSAAGKGNIELQKAQASSPKIIKTQGTNEYANVHCSFRDGGGNLWFGTTGEGVYVYDGKSFVNYTTKDGLSDNNVMCI